MDLFSDPAKTSPDTHSLKHATAPLAERLRPTCLQEVLGQEHLLGDGKPLKTMMDRDAWKSMIFYGPPGCGKTSLARMIASFTQARFIAINAVTSSLQELRKIQDEARKYRSQGVRTLLFIDEIHRFNKAQQDALMPEVERGVITLIAATTMNPSFVVNAPLVSRSLLFEIKPLEPVHLEQILDRALSDKIRGLGMYEVQINKDARQYLLSYSEGDARRLLNALELSFLLSSSVTSNRACITLDVLKSATLTKGIRYDRQGDGHYDHISAFIKSMRSSNSGQAIYWLAKMLEAGEDPRFIVRRMIIFASEDIGNAEPQALILAVSALRAAEFVGLPEAKIILSQLCMFLSAAPKCRSAYEAIQNASQKIQSERTLEVPDSLKNI